MNLRVNHEPDDDPYILVLEDRDTGQKRWYDVMVLVNMYRDDLTQEEIWAAGATEHDMFELNTLINLWRNR